MPKAIERDQFIRIRLSVILGLELTIAPAIGRMALNWGQPTVG